jgi:hypothetical protein
MTTLQQPVSTSAQRMSKLDARIALRRIVKRSGFTLSELRKQAQAGEFETLRARVAWIAIQAIEGA